jgi:phospholipase D1/2
MAGKPYQVGRFAHTLRVRLMREHLGVDVDAMHEDDLMAADPVKAEHEQDVWDPENEQERGKEEGVTHVGHRERRTAAKSAVTEFGGALAQGASRVARVVRECLASAQ